MPIKLSDIVAKQRWIDVEVADESVRVAYKPHAITLRRATELERLTAKLDEDPSIEANIEIARMFCDLVSEWDITGDDGKPYPIEVESLQDFPANILTLIMRAVQEDVEGHANEKKASSAT